MSISTRNAHVFSVNNLLRISPPKMIKQSLQSMALGLASFAAMSVLLVPSVEAAPFVPGICSVDDVQITEIKKQDGSPALAYPSDADPLSASGCIGAIEGNDYIYDIGDNRGFKDIGMLNDTTQFPDSGAFLEPEDLLDLQGLGTKQDPGWIFVGKTNYNTNGSVGLIENGTIVNGADSYTFNISDILTLTFGSDTKSGTFVYKPPVTNPQALLDVLGANKFFDQAAVILKAGNSYAIYNFKISDLGLPPVIGTEEVNFMFSGTFSLPGTFVTNGGTTPGLSHVSLWLRDPFGDSNTVPAPGTLLSLMLGLGLMLAGRKYRVTH